MPRFALDDIRVSEVNSRILAETVMPGNFIADMAVTPVPVAKDTGIIYKRTMTIRGEDAKLPYGSLSKKHDHDGYDQLTYHSERYGLHDSYEDEEANEYDVPLDLENEMAMDLRLQLEIAKEIRIKNILFTADNYASGHTDALTGTARWGGSAANPVKNIQDAKAAVLAATGKNPTTLALGYQAWAGLLTDSAIRDLLKTTQDKSIEAITRSLAPLLGIDEILVGQAINDTAKEGATATNAFIWGKDAAIYVKDPLATRRNGSFAIQPRKYDFSVAKWKQEPRNNMIEVIYHQDELILDNKAGFHLATVVT